MKNRLKMCPPQWYQLTEDQRRAMIHAVRTIPRGGGGNVDGVSITTFTMTSIGLHERRAQFIPEDPCRKHDIVEFGFSDATQNYPTKLFINGCREMEYFYNEN